MTNDEMTPAIKEPTVTHESKKKNKQKNNNIGIDHGNDQKQKKIVPFHPKLSIRNIKKSKRN